ncbi:MULTISPECIES: TetR/AcrR family transcriptional regulator [unclassified Nesterenkonia]|uniref:TetR/AcrR family transcriptional regulator n=1 Tax=unclassified Nesterenkonia TaxID=2629769 RepID=UPI001F4C953C|nr:MULTISPECIES: TetR/AcrR family transcriptional regulator [unclassified Nesterenkonia]MCH8559934.1 TetR/AcrR family transcriptional regulator [Nesterenkonia sp. DZ6]MCH8562114.1 TetR/AcrR family transcriptional regulator [Nesterenkonia sp. YGD6]MCH8569982.1 TetR/AcrR family transcriptional regulator [Nesterenkonia sp. AY15]
MTPTSTTASASRRGRPGYDREGLITVCVETFNRHGYEATSMGALSRELGISKSAIYHHVSSKEEILDIALNRSLAELERVITEAEALDASAVAELEMILSESVKVLTTSLPYVTLLLRLRGNSEMEVKALQRRREITLRIADLIRQAQNDGDLRQDIDARTASRLAMGTINSIVDWYRPVGGAPDAALAETVKQIILGGLRTAERR